MAEELLTNDELSNVVSDIDEKLVEISENQNADDQFDYDDEEYYEEEEYEGGYFTPEEVDRFTSKEESNKEVAEKTEETNNILNRVFGEMAMFNKNSEETNELLGEREDNIDEIEEKIVETSADMPKIEEQKTPPKTQSTEEYSAPINKEYAEKKRREDELYMLAIQEDRKQRKEKEKKDAEIINNIENVTNNIDESTQTQTENTENISNELETVNVNNEELSNSITESNENLTENINNANENLTENISTTNQELVNNSKEINEINEKTEKNIAELNETNVKNSENIQEQLNNTENIIKEEQGIGANIQDNSYLYNSDASNFFESFFDITEGGTSQIENTATATENTNVATTDIIQKAVVSEAATNVITEKPPVPTNIEQVKEETQPEKIEEKQTSKKETEQPKTTTTENVTNVNNSESNVNQNSQSSEKLEALMTQLIEINSAMLNIQASNSNKGTIHKMKNGPISN